ncbi:DUF5717 family protein [Anaerocolumna xylanovorans]|uniref:DUF5717 domain-containing protein n=1 Tax=Anaerocolumna xylanovorans DSM 12503 TaxID=1121345 RepID=A0A1M7YGZ2_9FIRM|nr:DUF5717 family protein [Anaerocolumna xylanovorans]SHO51934.1 hypothetical protein SAMN02745217_03417 [Anaerocolumna xylanovorans DSM 12503]
MKEKIKQLAGGCFEYESPALLLSEEELIITVDAGGCYKGTLAVWNSLGTILTGQLYSSSTYFLTEKNVFTGERCEIAYTVQANTLVPGDMVRGFLDIVSDSGEARIPFFITAEPPYLNSSLGKVKDFFHFTNLAKTDWAEAVKLFKTEGFREFLGYRDKKYLVLYDALKKSRSASQALEEFLIAVRKKTPVNFIVDKNILEYEVGTESFMDKIVLMKDNWGYEEIRVSCEGDFIVPEHKIIWSDYFVGNTYPLEFVIQPPKMRKGRNYGKIILSSVHDTIVVEITAMRKSEKEEEKHRKRHIREKVISCVRNYLNFRENRISPEEYTQNTAAELRGLKSGDKNNLLWYKLLEIHLMQTADMGTAEKEDEAKAALNTLKAEVMEKKQEEPAFVCAYWYLLALIDKSEEIAAAALKEIRDIYHMNSYDYRIVWFLLYIDRKFDSNKGQALELLKEQFYHGCRSPYLYFEALLIYKENPVQLTELGDFEIQVLLFGAKENYTDGELAGQFAYLAAKKREFVSGIYYCLTLLYRNFSEKDGNEEQALLSNLLTAILSLLIKGHKRGKKYFTWYQQGVKEQLRITELYEYYLYSYDEEEQNKLPMPVLLYFIYNSSLSDRKRAFLYAYIIKNKEELASIYRSYSKKIENFGKRMLKEHVIDRNLSVVYEELITMNGFTEEIGEDLSFVMFKQELCCKNSSIKGVITVHAETGEEVYTPLVSNCTLIDLYTENHEILLVDNQDNRYAKTVAYTLYPFLGKDNYLMDCLKHTCRNPMVLLNYADKIDTYQKFDDESVQIRRSLLELPFLKESYKSKIQMELISFYYDNFQGDYLEDYLEQITLKNLAKADRVKVTELLIIRNFYGEAKKALEEYGFEDIQINRLIKICTWLLSEKTSEDDELVLKLCFYIYKAGKYNEEILIYLSRQYEGATRELYSLWEAACGFEVDTCILEERLLMQMLLTREYLINSPQVFLKYYQRGCNRKLIRAFLSYHAYKYLINGRILKGELFQVMRRELIYEENDVCMLALLKKLSKEECFDESEKEFIDYNLQRFLRRGIILPFFKDFKGVLPLNEKINSSCFVEYISNPGHRVFIHYRMEDQEEFTEEEMTDMFLGIHVKDFILFADESLQYYISEGEGPQAVITESGSLKAEQEISEEEDTPYDQINFMITALEMNDYESVQESILHYGENRYLIKDLFGI